MKLIDRIAYIGFWINIFFLIFNFIGMPIFFMKTPDFFKLITANGRMNPYYLTYSFFNIVSVFHWGYCIWFLFKYDRYSKSIIPLFFLNALYAPFYYYRVKIKKRPLRNKVNKPQVITTDEYAIDEQDFISLTRESIIGTLNLWASGIEQLKLRDIYDSKEISVELFDYWSDYTRTDIEVLNEVFNPQEIGLLAEFDMELKNIENKYSKDFPPIEEFMETLDWKTLHHLANDILKKIK